MRRGWNRLHSRYWFVSFPKSGRTWTWRVVAAYLSRLHGLPAFAYPEFMPPLRRGAWRQVPRVHFAHPHCRDADPAVTARFMAGLKRKRVIVVVRDPRDVVVTYRARLCVRQRDPEALGLGLPAFVRHGTLGIGRIVDFTNQWHGAGGAVGSLLCLRFEDLRDEPLVHFPRLLWYLGLHVDEALLAQVVRETPDTTTTAIESGGDRPGTADLAYMEREMSRLDPALGYAPRAEEDR